MYSEVAGYSVPVRARPEELAKAMHDAGADGLWQHDRLKPKTQYS